MVTIVLKTDYQSKDHTYPVIIRVRHGSKVKQLNTGYKVEKKHFSKGVIVKHEDADIINSIIGSLVSKAKKYLADCIINERPVNLNVVFTSKKAINFCQYILHRADQYKNKSIVMWQKLTRFEKELTDCFKGQVYMDEITADNLRKFENYLLEKSENHPNTIAKKFRFLKQLYQNALDEGLHIGANPFKKHQIQTYPTKKEKLSTKEIQAIESLDLTGASNDARNLFLFSYYAKGARFENCIFLKRSQIKDGRISFTTNKGRKHISVLISSKLQKIIDQYQGEFIFPYVKNIPTDPAEYRSLKDSLNSVVNRSLKIVGGLAGLKTKLTFHVSRHSIAMALKRSGVQVSQIKDVLGHSSERTTEIYLNSLDDEVLDDEMKKVYGE